MNRYVSDMPRITKSAVAGDVSRLIRVIRGQRVLLDADLAALYGVTTARLNQQVRRNVERFPANFMFRLTPEEQERLMLQFATSKTGRGGRRKLALAFTEHGAIMAATVVNSPRAVQMSLYVVRAFVKLREALASHAELARKLEALERSVASLDARSRRQFNEVYTAILALMGPTTTAQ